MEDRPYLPASFQQATARKRTTRPNGRVPLLSQRDKRRVADLVDVGLSLLEGFRRVGPVAKVLRFVVGLGSAGIPDQRTLFERLRDCRERMKELERHPYPTVEHRREQKRLCQEVLVLLDMLLDQG
jgi:hypothetical protein